MSAPETTGRWTKHLLVLVRSAIGVLFFQHGAKKMWGFVGGRIHRNFPALRGFAVPLELVGGLLITFGLFSRFAAFILCAETAIAYFTRWAPRPFRSITNGGEEAVIFCGAWITCFTRGPA